MTPEICATAESIVSLLISSGMNSENGPALLIQIAADIARDAHPQDFKERIAHMAAAAIRNPVGKPVNIN